MNSVPVNSGDVLMSELLSQAQTLENQEHIPQAIQAYEDVIRGDADSQNLAIANHRLGIIYKDWSEYIAANRFFTNAHRLYPENTDILKSVDSLREYFSDHRDQIANQLSQKNSDQIVSLFRIATGIKLLAMDKPTQAYPLMKSRTKIYPNAAVAKHLLTDIRITEDDRNTAIEFLINNNWLISHGDELYTISDSGLYAFYTELAKLHTDSLAYVEAVECYDQAIWLDNSQSVPLFQKVICYVELEEWDTAEFEINKLPTEIPNEIDASAFHSAIAECYHNIFQITRDDKDKQRVIKACEEVLQIDKKNKTISNLLKAYQERKRWWQR